MRKALTALIAVSAVTVLSGVILAQSKTSKTTKPAPVAHNTFQGDIVAVDLKDQVFTVKKTEAGKVEEMKFHVAPGSKIMIDGSPKLLAELKKGEHVTVTYETMADHHMAKQVKRHKA